MFGLTCRTQRFVLLFTIAVLAFATVGSQAQSTRRSRRESNANRQARIAREIQDTYTHRFEVAGGGGYLRFRSGEYLRKNSEITFFGSGTYFLSNKLGIEADARGAYGNAKVGNNPFLSFNPQISEYAFVGGPAYRFYAKRKYAVTGFIGGGYGIGKFDTGSKGVSSANLGLWTSESRPVVTASVHLDYNLFPNLALRVSPTYLGTLFRGTDPNTGGTNGSIQNNLGVNIGIVYRFGRIK